VMRIAAQWTESEENLPDDFEPAWLGIGYITAELGGLLILISAILAGIGLRRSREDSTRSVLFARIVGIVCILLLAAYLVAMWAMTAKPD
jgi:biotin transporter BioY